MSIESLAAAFAQTRAILQRVSPNQHGDPTPCDSWTVRDLANHIVEGANWFAMCVDAGAYPDPDPTHGFDYAAGDLLGSYDEGVAASLAAFAGDGALERTITLPFGDMPGAAFLVMATDDIYVHGWDLAVATGQPAELDQSLAEQLLGQMGAMISDELRGADGLAPFGPQREPAAGATPVERLASFLGRKV